MLKNKMVPFIISLALLCAVIGFSLPKDGDSTGLMSTPDETASPVGQINVGEKDGEEMRGVWVSYLSLDMADTDRSEKAFSDKFDKIVKNCKDSGFNTLVVQVRPFSDALYKSKIFPSSHIITGTQGEKLGYDPLKIMCKKARENQMKIHAWVNPYRVSLKENPKLLSKENPYVMDNSLGFRADGSLYYNPALKEVRALIIDGVREVVQNYDVDGIQYDDYFYPTKDAEIDKTEYNAYKKSMENDKKALSLADWRMANVNMLIADTYRAVKSIKPHVAFGVSPQGNLGNNKELYADVHSWCAQNGYIDYICPQIYFSLDNPKLTFEKSLDSWIKLEKHNHLKLYIGLAGYKGGSDSDEGTWLDNDDILMQEIEILREQKAHGFMLYSYEALVNAQNAPEIENVVKLLNPEE